MKNSVTACKYSTAKLVFPSRPSTRWRKKSHRTDLLSCVLLATAVLTIFTWGWFGRTYRIAVSLFFESFGAPIHIMWLSHMVLAHNTVKQPWTNRFLRVPILQATGRASFSIYCVHFPVLRLYNQFVRSQTLNPGGGAPIIGIRVVPTYHFLPQLVVIFAFGFAIHHCVAKPLRTALVNRWAPRKNQGYEEEHLELIIRSKQANSANLT